MPDWEFSLHFAQWKDGRWGERRSDRRAASVSAVVSQFAGMTRAKATGDASVWEFLPWIDEPPPKREAESAGKAFGNETP